VTAKIPDPSLKRLCNIYQILGSALEEGRRRISSAEIGKKLGASAYIVRKDISHLPEGKGIEDSGKLGLGYDAKKLKHHIARALGLENPAKVCVVGLGKLGGAVIGYERLSPNGFEIAAGFDSNVNKLEMLKSRVELFPSHEIEDVVRAKGIEYAIITVPAGSAPEVLEQLVRGGVKGILNYSPVILPQDRDGVFILNIDIINDLRFMVSHITESKGEKE